MDPSIQSPYGPNKNIHMVFGTISETIGNNVRVKSEHEDEKLLGGIDQILFCTGYHYDFPFL